MPCTNQPFARIIMLASIVINARQSGNANMIQKAEININKYQSRGKNATAGHRPKHAHMPIKRAAKTKRNIAARSAK